MGCGTCRRSCICNGRGGEFFWQRPWGDVSGGGGALCFRQPGAGVASTEEGDIGILSEFEYLFPASNRSPSAGQTGGLPALELSENEQKVYDALDHEEVGIDDVIRKLGLPSSTVSVALLSLEMKRLIRQLPGKMFVKNT